TNIHRVLVLAAILAAAGAQASFANCLEFGGFPVFQCADRAYFDTIPNFDPNIYQTVDPNTGAIQIKNISATVWQIGFGNRTLKNGSGAQGTGIGSGGLFNGNDAGNLSAALRDGRDATGSASVPIGAVCLSSNDWGNTGVDGCCDNVRTSTGLAIDDDN